MAKRIGRPLKQPSSKRVSLGLKVTAAVKRHIDEAARVSGRTQSQEAEHLIEKALIFERALGEVEAWRNQQRARLDEIEQGNVAPAMHRQGYTAVHSPHGTIYFPPGYPGIERSRFISPEGES